MLQEINRRNSLVLVYACAKLMSELKIIIIIYVSNAMYYYNLHYYSVIHCSFHLYSISLGGPKSRALMVAIRAAINNAVC